MDDGSHVTSASVAFLDVNAQTVTWRPEAPIELDVSELEAAARQVEAIAATLRVHPKTVEAHMTRIYRRLGLASRSELAAWAVSGGLEPDDGIKSRGAPRGT
jgi:DNA-binding NarL/FixJ family response regulator